LRSNSRRATSRSREQASSSVQPSTVDVVRACLAATMDPAVVERVLATYEELKTNFYLGGHRLSAVEAGRFCEAVVRLLQQHATGTFTQLSEGLEVDRELRRLENCATTEESVRLHIPRAIRVVYGVRNKRDTAHLNDGIDPNIQDATLVAAVADWILAELVRLHNNVSPSAATAVVNDLVQRKAPLVQDFEGYLKVLDPELSAGDHILLLLYQCGTSGASTIQLNDWSRPSMRSNLMRTLDRLVHEKAWVHESDGHYFITTTGTIEIDRRQLMRPA
jgi:hypothetical protein